MKKNVVFYKCKTCGNLVGLINGDSDNLKCCGDNMEALIANTSDAAMEKHVPVYKKEGEEIIVSVGEAEHPMEEDHYIMWIAQVSENRTTRVRLYPGDKPCAKFPYIENSTLYAYCNKHSLWKCEVTQ